MARLIPTLESIGVEPKLFYQYVTDKVEEAKLLKRVGLAHPDPEEERKAEEERKMFSKLHRILVKEAING
jgi:hypothetical protein